MGTKKTDSCYCKSTVDIYGFFTEKTEPSEGANCFLTPIHKTTHMVFFPRFHPTPPPHCTTQGNALALEIILSSPPQISHLPWDLFHRHWNVLRHFSLLKSEITLNVILACPASQGDAEEGWQAGSTLRMLQLPMLSPWERRDYQCCWLRCHVFWRSRTCLHVKLFSYVTWDHSVQCVLARQLN